VKVLLAVASKHGSTEEIAQAIAVQLRMADFAVDRRAIEDVASIEGYDAIILGSAVYMGRLLPEVHAFVEANKVQLNNMPVWLFSSGPIGSPEPKPLGQAIDIEELVAAIHARSHRVFAGKLDKRELGLVERIGAKVVGAPEGDFRDWEKIEAWARDIARQLTGERVSGELPSM